MFRKLFKKTRKENKRVANNRMVYVHLQWVGQIGRVAERMPKCLLDRYVTEELIYNDYEIIAYI